MYLVNVKCLFHAQLRKKTRYTAVPGNVRARDAKTAFRTSVKRDW